MLTNYFKFNRNILYNSQLRGCITLPIACLFIYIFGVYIGLSSNSSECRVCVLFFNFLVKFKHKNQKKETQTKANFVREIITNALRKCL